MNLKLEIDTQTDANFKTTKHPSQHNTTMNATETSENFNNVPHAVKPNSCRVKRWALNKCQHTTQQQQPVCSTTDI